MGLIWPNKLIACVSSPSALLLADVEGHPKDWDPQPEGDDDQDQVRPVDIVPALLQICLTRWVYFFPMVTVGEGRGGLTISNGAKGIIFSYYGARHTTLRNTWTMRRAGLYLYGKHISVDSNWCYPDNINCRQTRLCHLVLGNISLCLSLIIISCISKQEKKTQISERENTFLVEFDSHHQRHPYDLGRHYLRNLLGHVIQHEADDDQIE